MADGRPHRLLLRRLGGRSGLCSGRPIRSLALLVLGFIVALQSSLMHEVLHGHPTRNALVNEAFVVPADRPRLAVSALQDDPSAAPCRRAADRSVRRSGKLLPGAVAARGAAAGDEVPAEGQQHHDRPLRARPVAGVHRLLHRRPKQIARRRPAIRNAWLLHAIGLAVVLPVVAFGFGIPLWLYILVPVWLGQALISIRTFAEHQWSEHPEGRTIIVERSPLSFLFLNNNLHFVHHKNPTVAWYRLPKLFRERRDEWVRMNHGYVVPNYFALLKAYAFKAKEPVVHPALRRAPEPGRAFGRACGRATSPALAPRRCRPSRRRNNFARACQFAWTFRMTIGGMSTFIAALADVRLARRRAPRPTRNGRGCATAFQRAGIDAPQTIVRRNAELPAVPGGIRDGDGKVIAPDPATLPPDELDFTTLWRHPALLLRQTCWGPMELGLAEHVQVVGQPSYDALRGRAGRALFERDPDAGGRGAGGRPHRPTAAPSSRST